jgi:beta-xylosidase
MQVQDTYYLYATTGGRPEAFSQYSSKDLVHWKSEGYMFGPEDKPAWISGDYWAPDVHQQGDHYVAYYTARDKTGRLCIGVGTSQSPTGPWKDSGQPLIHDPHVGVIDPNCLVDEDGKKYLYWKGDSNDLRPQEPTPIYVQELSQDGLSLVGDKREVLRNTLPWEADLVEGTCTVKHDGMYYMFYSANAYWNDHYATGVARSSSPLGPFLKKGDPVLASGGKFAGPGHGTVAHGPDGQDYYVYHAWDAGKTGEPNSRNVLLDKISWGADGWPTIHGGTPSDGNLA